MDRKRAAEDKAADKRRAKGDKLRAKQDGEEDNIHDTPADEAEGEASGRRRGGKQILGVLGCMAERLKDKMFEGTSKPDLIVGPDSYRDLPHLLHSVLETSISGGTSTAASVQLSFEETYAEIAPVRSDPSGLSTFVSVMRGCNNMCSFCVVPFTRGRERSREFETVVEEVRRLSGEGVKEVTLLGQNVNSYHDKSPSARLAKPDAVHSLSGCGFSNLYRLRGGSGYYFADLVAAVADVSPELRVRFTSPHPKDFPPELLRLVAERNNVCGSLGLGLGRANRAAVCGP